MNKFVFLLIIASVLSGCAPHIKNISTDSKLSKKISSPEYELSIEFSEPPLNGPINLKKMPDYYNNRAPYLKFFYYSDQKTYLDLCVTMIPFIYPCTKKDNEWHFRYIYGERINDTLFSFKVPNYRQWHRSVRVPFNFNSSTVHLVVLEPRDKVCNKTLTINKDKTELTIKVKSHNKNSEYCLELDDEK